jgi:transketolase
MAYTGKHFDKAAYRVYCLIGDGESAEGSIWEAACKLSTSTLTYYVFDYFCVYLLAFASHYKLDNLVAIFDINRLGQSEATMFGHHVDVYAKRMEAFG